jgi:glycosyltransferase involved in cell wall biosynthesis
MDAITICAANYLPFAEVLGDSFLYHNPDSTFSILVIDSQKVTYSINPKFNYLSPVDLEIPRNVFENMAFYYNVTELATALKPSALKALFKSGSQYVTYLDPDIQVFGELTELEKALKTNSIVLTPHTLSPMPRDGLRPSEAEIMASGTFNLGFIGLSKSDTASNMLDWWEERLQFDSISDPEEMLFTDQRWIDLVPSYFPIKVLREPGYNVAYWNLQERKLSKIDGIYKVNDSSLKFFHFSGYRPNSPWILSKYVSNNPRIVISNDLILDELCKTYGRCVVDAGWTAESALQYGYENFNNGNFIPTGIRRLYRRDCISAHKKGEIFKAPSDWQEWANSQSEESGNLSRVMYTVWRDRSDLQRRFPNALGNQSNDFMAWAKKHGVSERVIDTAFLEIETSNLSKKFKNISKKKGITVAGYLNAELGVGQSARLIYSVAQNTDFPVSLFNSNRVISRKEEIVESASSVDLEPLTVAIINADQFEIWVNDFGIENIQKTAVIGVWAWETEDFPPTMHHSFEFVDEVWAVSKFVKSAIEKHTKKPVYVFPTPIQTPKAVERLQRSMIGIPENSDYNLFIFDYMSVFNRKNPIGLIEAHCQAFPEENGPILVIKSMNGDRDPENREKLKSLVKNRKDIFLVEDYLSRAQLTSLINECSAYISLHRSEGYGLTLAEAMSLGRPVIATNYSGNLDFMNKDNSFLVPFKKVKIGEGSFPYSANSTWAEPNLSTAADFMREVFFNKEFSESIATKGKQAVLREFTLENATKFMKERANYHYALTRKVKRKLKPLSKKLRSTKKFTKQYLANLKNI